MAGQANAFSPLAKRARFLTRNAEWTSPHDCQPHPWRTGQPNVSVRLRALLSRSLAGAVLFGLARLSSLRIARIPTRRLSASWATFAEAARGLPSDGAQRPADALGRRRAGAPAADAASGPRTALWICLAVPAGDLGQLPVRVLAERKVFSRPPRDAAAGLCFSNHRTERTDTAARRRTGNAAECLLARPPRRLRDRSASSKGLFVARTRLLPRCLEHLVAAVRKPARL